jgi:hypothetical protein
MSNVVKSRIVCPSPKVLHTRAKAKYEAWWSLASVAAGTVVFI